MPLIVSYFISAAQSFAQVLQRSCPKGAVTLPCEGARAVYALRIFKPPRRPRATWSSPRRVARGEIELT